MKKLLFLLALLFTSCAASATDYFVGQCPIAVNCPFGSGQVASTWADTITIYTNNWTEPNGDVYEFTSSVRTLVQGVSGKTPCGRCQGKPYTVDVDSASIDGVPMQHYTVGHTAWILPGSLAPGLHVISASGHTTGEIWQGSRWGGWIQGIVWTFIPAPPPMCDEPPCD